MSDKRNYHFNTALNICETPAYTGSTYSDGNDVEERLLATLRQCQNVSSFSEELLEHIVDWPTEYHLSPIRHNLLRHFSFGPNDCILELGCGCGAITRYLGETGAQVIAVEGSRRRAAIAAERCRDLPNVSIYCDNLIDFETTTRFTYVTLIGVLEYSQQFISGADPVGQCLKKAADFLQEGGALLLAIENQFGLKYFAGCSEDHTGVPYFGINDLYGKKTAKTFGKQELEERLLLAGFQNTLFFYPFPDYKIPSLILSDEAFNHADFHIADLLPRKASRDYSGFKPLAFQEVLAWPSLSRNGLVRDLSNSFLISARKLAKTNLPVSKWLASSYSTGRRHMFATATTFLLDGSAIHVQKTILFSSTTISTPGPYKHHTEQRSIYVSGRLYGAELIPILAQGGNLDDLVRWLKPWFEQLVAMATTDTRGQITVPGALIDAIPTNMLRTPSGALTSIDLEWCADHPILLNWVLLRGLTLTLLACPIRQGLSGSCIADVVVAVMQNLGHTITENDLRLAVVLEDELQQMVFDSSHFRPSFDDLLKTPANIIPYSIHQQVWELQQEVKRIKSTASWQITKPLRLFQTILRKIIQK